ncbi:hypothetical protein LSUE1_G004641 [Lachnellula suecica]|uniref:C2H2-type domain-containing protein n=1 Tax=Lachnellula suecica TaxID=602035 RepID=A0A8T9CDH8_9HELO|nr:hypothetical protein LSUE1_G004641 [Lachnellula suecica]
MPFSTSSAKDMSYSVRVYPIVPAANTLLPDPGSIITPSVNEWLCDFDNCDQSFTHRHKLNRHRKYHRKDYPCLHSPCASRSIAFSLQKDLIRHQTKHNGRRIYCPRGGCSYALGGTEGGFTRRDNLKRHMRTKGH